jgi:hypothetical protein
MKKTVTRNGECCANGDVERNEHIRVRAYELFEQRGREEGRDMEDWLRAEAEMQGSARPRSKAS